MSLKLSPIYAVIEQSQLHVKAAVERGRLDGVEGETLAQLTLALRSLENAYDRVRRAEESDIATPARSDR